MTDVPNYQTPPTGGDPAQMVKLPAILLMVCAGLGFLGEVLGILANLFGVVIGGAGGGQDRFASMFSGTTGVVFGCVGILMAGLMLLGGFKMMKLQSYGLAMTAAIVALVPCISPCCIFSLPFGIWALVVLMKPEVKSAFH